jgi:hypothetical protein
MASATAHELFDRQQIMELLSRYFAAIDDKRLDDHSIADTTFAVDARLVSPDGSELVGPEAIFDGKAASFARFRTTHHVITDHIIDLDGETARLRANITAMHLWGFDKSDSHALQSHFVAGGVLDAVVVRTRDGWRLSKLSNRIAWRTGDGLAMMMAQRLMTEGGK